MFERVVKYGFHRTELNNFQAGLTEKLVKRYVKKTLIPELREQGWDAVIYVEQSPFQPQLDDSEPPERQGFWSKNEERVLVAEGLCPTRAFLRMFKKLTRVLEHSPDGFLLKLRKTGKTKSLGETLEELKLTGGWSIGRYRYNCSDHDKNQQLPIVNGEVELVEVKSGKAILHECQVKDYKKSLKQKFALRYFHVNILSFEKNVFEIEEKLITTIEELETVQLQRKVKRQA